MLEDCALPSGVTIESGTVLETAGVGAQEFLLDLLDSSCVTNESSSSKKDTDSYTDEPEVSQIQIVPPQQLDFSEAPEVVCVDFWVKSSARGFEVEQQAVNEATFRCPDEMGWQPDGIPIVEEDGDISHVRNAGFLMEKTVATLVQEQERFKVLMSRDIGRFVCNYVYYLSVRHAASHGTGAFSSMCRRSMSRICILS